VALLPRHVAALTGKAHEVLVERGAGLFSGAPDAAYLQSGAKIAASASEVFDAAEIVVKVKEILPPEYPLLRWDHIVFTNIHAALNRPQLDGFWKWALPPFPLKTPTLSGLPTVRWQVRLGPWKP